MGSRPEDAVTPAPAQRTCPVRTPGEASANRVKTKSFFFREASPKCNTTPHICLSSATVHDSQATEGKGHNSGATYIRIPPANVTPGQRLRRPVAQGDHLEHLIKQE